MPKNKEVEAWMRVYDNPMKPVVSRVREIILAADKRMDECIKWKSPTFSYGGNLSSFMPNAKKHANRMFHTGAKIPGKHPKLQGTGSTARFMTFADLKEANANKKDEPPRLSRRLWGALGFTEGRRAGPIATAYGV